MATNQAGALGPFWIRPGLKAGNNSGKWPSLFAAANSARAALSSLLPSLRFDCFCWLVNPAFALLPATLVNGKEPVDREPHVTSR